MVELFPLAPRIVLHVEDISTYVFSCVLFDLGKIYPRYPQITLLSQMTMLGLGRMLAVATADAISLVVSFTCVSFECVCVCVFWVGLFLSFVFLCFVVVDQKLKQIFNNKLDSTETTLRSIKIH